MNQFSQEYRILVCDEEVPPTREIFIQKLNSWFKSGRLYQFIVKDRKQHSVLGTIFFYSSDEFGAAIKLSCFFAPSARRTIRVSESLCLAIDFAKNIINAERILFSIYIENIAMIKLAERIGGNRIAKEPSVTNASRTVVTYCLSEASVSSIILKLKKLHRLSY